MNLFYTDDSALDPNKHTFFVYGGIEIPGENALWLHDAIERLRTKHGLNPDQALKYKELDSEGISLLHAPRFAFFFATRRSETYPRNQLKSHRIKLQFIALLRGTTQRLHMASG